MGIATLLYVISFGVLAKFGGYRLLPSGNYRPLMGLMEPDTWIWQPAYGTFFSYTTASGNNSIMADKMGYLYAPFILATQSLMRPPHAIQELSAEGYLEGKAFIPPLEELHPYWRKLAIEAKDGQHAEKEKAGARQN